MTSENRYDMSRRRALLLRVMLFVTLALGGLQMAIGLLVDPSVKVHIQLDTVLSPDELKDAATKEKTLEMLRRVAKGEERKAYVIMVAGLLVFVASAVGLVALETSRSVRPR